MRASSLSLPLAVLAVAAGCFSSPPTDPTAVEPEPEVVAERDGTKFVRRPRPKLGQSGLVGVLVREDDAMFVATCEGERVRLLDEGDAVRALKDAGEAYVTLDVERMGRDVDDINRGADGVAQVREVLFTRTRAEGDCGLTAEGPSVSMNALPAATFGVARHDRHVAVLSMTLAADLPDPFPGPFAAREALVGAMVGPTRAFCGTELGVHRVGWTVASAPGTFYGEFFLPCVMADQLAKRGGEAEHAQFAFTGADGVETVRAGQGVALDNAARQLAFQRMASKVPVSCDPQGRCPPWPVDIRRRSPGAPPEANAPEAAASP